MRYITNPDQCSINTTYICTEFNSYNVDDIVEDLVNLSDSITRKHNTSRSMWPNKDLVGVEFQKDEPEFEGYVKQGEIKVSTSDFDEFEYIYDELKSWFSFSDSIDLPPKSSFKVESFTFYSEKDGVKLEQDYTKSDQIDDLIGYRYQKNGVKSNYSTLQGMVSFLLTDPEKISISKFRSYVKSICDSKIIIKGDEEEIKTDTDQPGNSSGLL